MANTPDAVTCLEVGEILPLSPFYSLSYHFGMLLGVEDFETEQAYHRAKIRLHNAWLHREGVVWGFGVELKPESGEIRVGKGLALDAAGHELHLEGDACVNVGRWFAKHRDDPGFESEETEKGVSFTAHVCARFKACLTRQVPAMSEPCNGATGNGTAYSRVFETVQIELRPGPAPEKPRPYHRLRVLFGIEEARTDDGGAVTPGDQEVLDARAEVQALPADERPPALLRAFRRFAALDEIDLLPAKSADGERFLLFPGPDDEPVVLAEITDITLERQGEQWVLTGGEVNTSVRPSHVATTTIQDLLCGPLFEAPESSPAPETSPAPEPPADDGPHVLRESFQFTSSKNIMFEVDKELLGASVQPVAFNVTFFDPERGWATANVAAASYGGPETNTVWLELKRSVRGLVRLIARGTGPAPLLGANLYPLAGAAGEPAGTQHEGRNFVHMQEYTEPAQAEEEPPPPIPDAEESPRPIPSEEPTERGSAETEPPAPAEEGSRNAN